MGKILDIKNLEVAFEGSQATTYAVNNVSFDLVRGETLGIVGESGSGKSVTAKSILRLIDDQSIKNGELYFKGEDLLKKDPASMREIRGARIAMIFQDPMTSLNPLFTIGTQMDRLIKRHRTDMKKNKRQALAIKWLDAVGIPDARARLKSYPHEFSGGMRQRVMIAMALCLDPELIIADEPTTALDVTIQAQVLDLLNDLSQERERSLILITHDLGVVANTCDRVVVMYSGMVMEEGTVEEIFTNPQHPYTKGLLRSLPKKGGRERLTPIQGNPPDMTIKPDGCPFRDRCDQSQPICSQGLPAVKNFSASHRASCCLLEEGR